MIQCILKEFTTLNDITGIVRDIEGQTMNLLREILVSIDLTNDIKYLKLDSSKDHVLEGSVNDLHTQNLKLFTTRK